MNQSVRNILYVSHTADLRGSAMSLRELMTNLDRDRWRAHALLSKHGPLEEILTRAGISFAVLAERGLFKLRRIAYARRYLRQHSIDLVHLNSAVPFCRDIGIAARLAGVPVTWHIREDPQSKRVRRLARWIRLLSNRIIVVSSDLEEYFHASGKVVKVYNGIDLERFSPHGDDAGWRQRLGIGEDELVFVLVGTIEQRKGQHLAIEAAAKLVGQQRPFRLLIVGSPLTQIDQDRIDAALLRYPQVARITHCLGRQSEVAPILRAANCLMLPSAWEGFPRTVAEGMACGLPVIASTVGELPQMIESGAEGWLVPPNDIEALRAAMEHMMSTYNKEEMAQKARTRALEWSTAKHVGNIESIYAQLLQA